MARGKQTCRILKEIRRQIAEVNDIEFATSECRYKGDCLGTCPKCEAEVRYLEQQLRARSLAGKAVALAGISATALAMLMPMSADAQTPQESNDFRKGSVSELADTIRIKGIVLSGDTLPDGTISKNPLVGATITNHRVGQGIITNLDGEFSLEVLVGDSLEVSYVGYETQKIAVTESMKNMTITLMPSMALMGEVVVKGFVPVVKREEIHYLDLNVIDEHGNPIDNDDIYVERIWVDSEGEEDSRYIEVTSIDEKHPCRIYWDYDYGMRDEDGKPLKEATLRIEAEGYDTPVIIKVKYPKRNAKKTIKFRNKKK